jgi:AraC family transcriptional regulator
LRRTLLATQALRVELARYSAGARQPRHTDACSRITLTLRGGFSEETAHAETALGPGDVLFKSRHCAHANRFGDEGAQLVSIAFLADDFEAGASDRWRVRSDASALRHALAALEAAFADDNAGVEAAAADLLAACAPAPRRAAPAWLSRLKHALEATSLAAVDVAAEARAAGVHPAHASRLFRCCFGASVTEYAQAQSVRRALPALAGAAALSEIALAAGFYDQSHMNRVFRRVTGRTPGAHRALLAAAG